MKNDKLDYDEKTLKEKIKDKSGLAGIIGIGALGFVHTLSHVIPAIGAFGMAQIKEPEQVIRIFGYNVAPILTSRPMEIAYMAFVPLSFYYIYKDHKHHNHERKIRKELEETRKELMELKMKNKEDIKNLHN